MSRLVLRLGRDDKVSVDHVNGDKLDNRKCNLRVCTHKQNLRNQKKHRNGAASYKGVSGRATASGRVRYRATITVDYRQLCLGTFATELEAAVAYNAAALEHHGEFARLNELPTADRPVGGGGPSHQDR